MDRLRIILLPLSWLYGVVIRVRNYCFDKRIFRVREVSVPVISVGNLTAGGTGKTPFVEYLIRHFLNHQTTVAVVSRGYKRTSRGTVVVSDGNALGATAAAAGDEPYQVARKFPQVPVLVDRNRARAAWVAAERFNPDVIILDDGFQHRALSRTLDLVMIDGGTPLRDIPLLPAGLRREPMAALGRADMLMISQPHGSKGCPQQDLRRHTGAPHCTWLRKPKSLRGMGTGMRIEPDSVRGKSAVAFCGIGNPESFRRTLEEMQLNIREWIRFPDHHRYSASDCSRIQTRCEELKPDFLVTTEKDSVRIAPLAWGSFSLTRLCYVEIEIEILEGEAALHALLRSIRSGDPV